MGTSVRKEPSWCPYTQGKLFKICCKVQFMFNFNIQSIPSGVPALVIPNEAKVDLKHLKADLPKYGTAGLASATIEWWHSFIDSLEKSMREQQQPSASSSWLYSELLELARSGVRRARSVASLPSQLIAMRASEAEPLPEVI